MILRIKIPRIVKMEKTAINQKCTREGAFLCFDKLDLFIPNT